MSKSVDIADFARRVERLCDFLINRVKDEDGLDGGSDLRVIQDLKEDAADLQFKDATIFTDKLEGLSDFMKGANTHESRPNGDQ